MDNTKKANSFFIEGITERDKKQLAKNLGYSLKEPIVGEKTKILFAKYYKYRKNEELDFSPRQEAAFFGMCLYSYISLNQKLSDDRNVGLIDVFKSIYNNPNISDTQKNKIDKIISSNHIIKTQNVCKLLGDVLRSLKELPMCIYGLNYEKTMWELYDFNNYTRRLNIRLNWAKNINNINEENYEEEYKNQH